jgi:hypothetical protein
MIPLLGLLGALLPSVEKIIDRVIPDPVAAEKAKAEIRNTMFENLSSSDLAQTEVNKAEIATGKLGWRWGMGWTCVISLAYAWIVRDLIIWGMVLSGGDITLAPPLLDTGTQYSIVTGMLGLAGVRAYDLQKGSRG